MSISIGSGQATPVDALAQALPESLYQGQGLGEVEQQDDPEIAVAVKRSGAFHLSILSVLAGIQVVWLAVLVYAILTILR
jgi:hypothetical protein